tara:strand:+ start:290 stop:598 length:309 start_codon:yes stop_codon:yes gene_type:complete
MKAIIVNDQKFTNKVAFIDYAGDIKAKAKQIDKQKDILRAFRHGNHFGKDFTMIVKAAYKGGGVDVEALKELALKHGAKLKDIEACKLPRVSSANSVTFTKN